MLDDLYKSLQLRDDDLSKDMMHCGLGVQSCFKQQSISKVTFNKPAMLLVVRGSKEIQVPNKRFVAKAGEMLIVPPNVDFWLGKYPDKENGVYQGLGFRFDIETVEEFRRAYGKGSENWNLAANWRAPASEAILEWTQQWLDWSRKYPVSLQVQRHRLVELLLLLAQSGLAGNVILGRGSSWRLRVSQLVGVDPARDWRYGHVCRTLGISESAMRRKLKLEGTGFREVLEETRLMTGLTMVQETGMTICQISDAVGYQSQSRFTDRFKERFGVTPSSLRRSGLADEGECLLGQGEEFSD
ncbi:helix-turn-helix domain-containing protein [Roseovarius sp. CAU 1744]|uniref:AraC family transcriptional regulator n=1 Tax=Roseovarius sp. CAU 1744 TaxID=3140368 RepID=UPI00325BB606